MKLDRSPLHVCGMVITIKFSIEVFHHLFTFLFVNNHWDFENHWANWE